MRARDRVEGKDIQTTASRNVLSGLLTRSQGGLHCEANSLSLRSGEGQGGEIRDRFQPMFSRLSPLPGPIGIELERNRPRSSPSLPTEEERAGERSRVFIGFPLPNPPPARSSRGEGDGRSTFQCLIQWPCPKGEGVARLEGGVRNAEVAAQSEHGLVSGVPAGRFAMTGPTGSLSQRELANF